MGLKEDQQSVKWGYMRIRGWSMRFWEREVRRSVTQTLQVSQEDARLSRRGFLGRTRLGTLSGFGGYRVAQPNGHHCAPLRLHSHVEARLQRSRGRASRAALLVGVGGAHYGHGVNVRGEQGARPGSRREVQTRVRSAPTRRADVVRGSGFALRLH